MSLQWCRKNILTACGSLILLLSFLFFSICCASSAFTATQQAWNTYQTPFFSGSFNYAYKIDLPPGTHGLTPSLALSYNSFHAKNKAGWVGAGWEIPLNYIQSNTNGTFSLFINGAKHDLIDLTVVDGRYHTKIETYLKIEKKTGAANEKGEYWAVYDTSGTEYRFGANPDSENMINASGTPYVWRWSLDRIKDTNGNCVYFTYAENPTANDLGAVYLSKIEYNTEKKRLVEFILEDADRSDMTTIVDQGSNVQEARRLKEIRVSLDGQLVKKLAFQYGVSTTTSISLLSSITKYGVGGANALPPELFEYTTFVDGAGISTDLLTKVTGTLGDVTTIGYSASSTALNTTLPENYWLVTSIAQANGITGAHALSATSTIAYENGAYDAASQEFRGFGKVTETRPDGSKAVHTFFQDDALKGRIHNSTIFDAPGAPYSGTANVWMSSLANGVYAIQLQQTERYTYDGTLSNPKTTRTEYGNYDAYGNAGLIINHGDLAVTGDETATVKEFVYNPDMWIVNRVKHSTITAGVGGTKLRESWFYYDRAFDIATPPFAGNLTKEEHWNNGGENPVVQYKYDAYGNLIRKTDPLGNSSEIVYDATYQTFPVFVYNAKGHVTTTAFNPVIGKPVSVTDPNGNVTTYAYDEFNRLTKIVKPGDSVDFPTTEMQYVVNSAPPHLVIVKNRETTGGSTFDSVQVIDGLGKTIQTKSESDSSANMIASDTYYDVMGRVAKQSNPYLADSALAYGTPDTGVVSTRTEYDVLGRATRITHPDSTFTANAYLHWTVTETDENAIVKSKTYDADNNLIRVVENNQGAAYTTNYQYSLMDKLLSVTDHLNNKSTHEYDSLGRKTKTLDVDFGQKLFSYDLAGNLISQTDARGITVKYQYDVLNRQTLVDYPTDKDIQFVYDLETKGTLSRVYNSLGMDSYQYDSRLRKIREDRTMDGQTWTTTYAYDAMDRLVSQTYPDGEIVQYTYNSRDKLATIQHGGQTLLGGMTYNPAGQLTQKTYGNNWITAYSYDSNNLRLTGIATTKPSVTPLQNLAYTYDSVGNVKTLADALAGRTETFVYDDLYRMVGAGDNLATGGFNKSYDYNAVGNLTLEKDNKAVTEIRYSYGQDTAKPHAVTGKTSTDGLPIIGSLVINKGTAYCTGSQVTLDNVSMGVTPGVVTDFYMASQDDKNFTGATWQAFSTTPVFNLANLPSGFNTSQNITIYFKVKNAKGESQVKSASIQWLSDVDGDGIPDKDDTDNDNDGIPDVWETANGLNPFDASDAAKKPSGDELTYLQKYTYGLNPTKPDSDGDGWSDYHEIFVSKTNPNLADTDKDGILDPADKSPNNPYNEGFSENYSVKRWTFNAGGGARSSASYIAADTLGGGFSNPSGDKDGDGMPDQWETDHGLDPANPADSTGDADGDGLTNLQEYLRGTNPKAKDTDGDGWSDYQEIFINKTNPAAKDTDGDGIADPQDPDPNKQTYIYGTSENYTIRNGRFNAGGNSRVGTVYAVAQDRIDGLSAVGAVYHATFAVTPEGVNFESTELNQSKTQTLTVSNKGIGNLIIGTVYLTGADGTEFALSQENCSGQVLSPAVSCSMQISFLPQSAGAKGVVLSIQYNDGEVKNADIAVSGIATVTTPIILTVSKTGAGTGTVDSSPSGIHCGSTCTGSYASGTDVVLTAAANAGSVFAGWSGGDCSGTGTCVVTMDGPITVTALFALIPVVSTPPTTGQTGGTITINGSNFGATQGLGYVDFNAVRGTIISWSDTQIVVRIPVGAASGCLKIVTEYGESDCINFTVIAAPLYASFANAGIWKFNGTDWTQTTSSNPQLLVTVGADLYGTFEGLGIWKFNGTDWTQTTTSVPQMIVGSSTTLYGAFADAGIWQWNGTDWTQTTASNPQKIVASTSDLYGAFEGLGVWKFQGTGWTQLTTSIPDLLVTSGEKLYGTFAGLGIWLWNGTQWIQATPNTPQMIAANSTTLYGTFEGQGIWSWDGASTWTQISTENPTQMVASGTELYASFAGTGIRKWDGTAWTQISGNDPIRMVVGN